MTFSESVSGVDTGDFALADTGTASGTIASVSGSGTSYTVMVNNLLGVGTLGLNLVDNDSIVDSAGNPLGGVGTGNGNFTGQTYTVDHTDTIGLYNGTASAFYLRNTNTTGTPTSMLTLVRPAAAGCPGRRLGRQWHGNHRPVRSGHVSFLSAEQQHQRSGRRQLPIWPGQWRLVADCRRLERRRGGHHRSVQSHDIGVLPAKHQHIRRCRCDVRLWRCQCRLVPIAGDWNHDGTDTIGLYNPTMSHFYLKNSNTTGAADINFGYGQANAGWKPIIGDWNTDGTDTIGLYPR